MRVSRASDFWRKLKFQCGERVAKANNVLGDGEVFEGIRFCCVVRFVSVYLILKEREDSCFFKNFRGSFIINEFVLIKLT